MLFVLIVVLLVVSPFLLFSAQGANVNQLSPSADSWVDFKTPDTNYGNDIEIHVKADKQTRRSYLKFDLSALPAGTTVTSAKLYLYCTAGTPTLLPVDVHETNDSWSEDTLTWNNAPAVGAFVTSNTTVDGVGKYYSWDITSYTQSQFGGDKILSVVVKFPLDDPYQNNPNVHRDFASKEETDPNKHPYLETTYTGPAPLSVSISPTSVAMNLGQHVTFTSNVSGGTPPYSYQWYLNDTAVPGASASSWTFTPISVGFYMIYLNVTDNVGTTAKSNTANVTVNPQLTVSISPHSTTITLGQSVLFTSTVSGGTPPYSYQWYLNGAPVSGATSASWTFTPTSAGSYTVYINVTDNVGVTVQSNTASVAVNPAISVSITPTSVVMDVGQSKTFTSSVSGGTQPYTYQWYLDDNPVSGATSSSWTFTPTSVGSYTVYLNVTDNAGATAQSNTVPVTVNPWPTVSITPTSVVMDMGQSVTFTSTVSGGTPPYTYQWYLNDVPVTGATSPTWTFTPTSPGSYTVYVNVTDSGDPTVKSNVASVTVNLPLSVSISPTSVTMDVGQSQTFTSSVSGGTSPYSYQWYLNGAPISGATSPSWTFTPTSPGSYIVYVNVTDNVGVTAKSNTASVTVNPSLAVTISPTSMTMDLDQSKTFTSTVSGGVSPYSYRWYLNDTAVPGATASSWTFSPTSTGFYTVYVNVTDNVGATAKSNTADVTVNPQLTVSISPPSATIALGQSVLFNSTVSGGTLPYTYQWDVNGTWVPGETNPTFNFTPTQPVYYNISLLVTDNAGANASTFASVTVQPPEFYLTVETDPTNITTIPGEGWYGNCTHVNLNATEFVPVSPGVRYRFDYWDVDGANVSGNPITVHMDANHTATAHYVPQYYLNISTNSGTVAPGSGWHDAGSTIQISTSAPSVVDGERYVWLGWIGTGTGSYSGMDNPATITMNGPITETAYWRHEYRLTMDTNFGATNPSVGEHWYEAGSTIEINATAPSVISGERYEWLGWTGTGSGSYSSTDNPASVTMDGPINETAAWRHEYYLTVTSLHGSPTPESGWFEAEESITASVTSPVSGPAGTRYVCTGLTGTGSVPTSGATTSVTFTINVPSSITWDWKTQYLLTVRTDPTGLSPQPTRSPTGEAGTGGWWYDSTTSVQLTAQPVTNYDFLNWDVDTNPVSGNPITVPMDGPHTATAHYQRKEAPPPVGGYALPINIDVGASNSLIPQIGLASVLPAAMAVAIILTRRRKKTLKRKH